MKNVPQSAAALKKILLHGKTFCLVGGAFDLIHVGHLHLLEYAATLEDLLVVAVLSDNYVRGYKNSSRPIINQRQRATMVAALRVVDYVYIARASPNSPRVLALLKPTSVVFGENGRDEVRLQQRIAQVRASSPDTKIQILPRYTKEEISTGRIIKKIRSS
jgi:cytidyltransferase-like protein